MSNWIPTTNHSIDPGAQVSVSADDPETLIILGSHFRARNVLQPVGVIDTLRSFCIVTERWRITGHLIQSHHVTGTGTEASFYEAAQDVSVSYPDGESGTTTYSLGRFGGRVVYAHKGDGSFDALLSGLYEWAAARNPLGV